MRIRNLVSIGSLFLFIAVFSIGGVASAKSKDELTLLLNDSAAVLSEIADMPDNRIPDNILQNADAIVIIPEMYKGGFLLAGTVGDGVISVRDKSGEWSPPSFVQLIGGSIGWQIGGQKTELVLVIIGRHAVDMFLENNFKIGADLSVAAGPVGRKGEAAVDYQLDNQIYSYSRSMGIFAGISLEGTNIGIEDNYNNTYYGNGATPRKILIQRSVKKTNAVNKLINTLDKHIP